MSQVKQTVTLESNLWFSRKQDCFLGGDQTDIIGKIDEFGSISQAAKVVETIYRTAWEIG